MSIELNHTIVAARDPQASAKFLADILGLPVDPPVAHFTPVTLTNRVTLDYDHNPGTITPCHYAFLLGDEEFEAAFARIQDAGVTYYADPACQKTGQIYQHDYDGARGAYFRDPDNHLMEILTKPAG
jgi:catechol 2,3-dioxygenase-like lactoylglutathione lyase family enzyme